MTFQIGDYVQLEPEMVNYWVKNNNNWWLNYGFNPDETLVVSGINFYVEISRLDGKKIGNINASDLIPALGKESVILQRIDKLYKKYPHTKHWKVNYGSEI